jgi:ligand-binding SRPBCC domain-containing protein
MEVVLTFRESESMLEFLTPLLVITMLDSSRISFSSRARTKLSSVVSWPGYRWLAVATDWVTLPEYMRLFDRFYYTCNEEEFWLPLPR